MVIFPDPPGQPGIPDIVDWDVDRVDLKWTAPKFNGGAPITGYIIEKKERFGGNWEEILTTEVANIDYITSFFVARTIISHRSSV